MKLAELQAEFQRGILGESDKILDSICQTPRLSRDDRFAVYADAYRLRLAEIVGNDFSILHNALGDEEFGTLVFAYIEATASEHRNARWYSRKLPDFMASDEAWRDKRLWIDLAYFERALSDAFDAQDAEPVAIDALVAIADEDQPNMRFDFQPSLAILTLSGGTVAAYEAAAADEIVETTSEPGQDVVLVWRDQELDPVYRLIDEDEAMAFDAARNGGSFGEICALLSLKMDGEAVAATAAQLLGRWFGDGLVTGLSVTQA